MADMGIGGNFAAGAGADALEQLLQRAFVEQQARIRTKQEQQRIDIEQQRMRQIDEDRKASEADLARSRAIQNATRISGQLRPNQTISQETIAALSAGGMGDLVQHQGATLPSVALSGGAEAGAKAPLMGTLRMMPAGSPERDVFSGTADQLAAETARTDRIAQTEQARQDRLAAAKQAEDFKREMAANAQSGREDIARLTAGLRGGNADLQREILQQKIDTTNDKTAQAKQTADTARNAALASIDDTSSALDELIDTHGNLKPGVGGAVGWDRLRGSIPGTSAADAKARIDRLQSRLTVDLLGEMKRQSRTGASGFGALSEKELAVLQNAAARLGTSQSDESFRQALVDIRKQLMGMRQRASGGAPAPGGTPQKETPEQRIQRLLGGG